MLLWSVDRLACGVIAAAKTFATHKWVMTGTPEIISVKGRVADQPSGSTGEHWGVKRISFIVSNQQ
jgi:hypothetical protein